MHEEINCSNNFMCIPPHNSLYIQNAVLPASLSHDFVVDQSIENDNYMNTAHSSKTTRPAQSNQYFRYQKCSEREELLFPLNSSILE